VPAVPDVGREQFREALAEAVLHDAVLEPRVIRRDARGQGIEEFIGDSCVCFVMAYDVVQRSEPTVPPGTVMVIRAGVLDDSIR
jgi:hypothetical protein